MRKGLYAVHDRLSEDFSPLFEAQNDKLALRMYQNMIRNTENFPVSDATLYRIGWIENTYPAKLENDFEIVAMEVSE